jgi:hypothetical protein
MNAIVQIHSDDADGTVRTISLTRTAADMHSFLIQPAIPLLIADNA